MPDESPNVAELSPDWRRGFEWVEGELGGRVRNLRRQGRWRPAWFFDLERDGETLPLYFRGDRGHAETERVASVLDHEANIYRVLEANGLPVPHVHAMCPAPRGIVMDRCPGRFNLATLEDREQARAILEHYIELLVGMHAIEPAEFEAYGMERRGGERALALGDFDQWVAQFRRAKRRPEPALRAQEFDSVQRLLQARTHPTPSCPHALRPDGGAGETLCRTTGGRRWWMLVCFQQ